ncbi:MAG: 2,3-bisphosphoglycerate-independent phosphoglycerate mutase [archaeon]
MVKGILVIIDGMGDIPNKQLENMTPLGAANTPNMDFLATRGEMGILYPVRPGFTPESDESVISLFGNDLVFGTRGQLEAIGADLELTRGDLALRANFSTIDSIDKGNILDRRAGRTLTARETEILADEINKKVKLPCEFLFVPTLQHQAVLVFRGGFSENVLGNDPTYIQGKTSQITKIKYPSPLDDDENSQYTANILNEFVKKSHEILKNHYINQERKEKGLLPTNYILFRGLGIEPPKLKKYKKWLSITYFPLEKGFSKVSGMEVFSFDYPKLKEIDSYSNIWEGLKKACKFAIKTIKKQHKNFDYAYIHINEPDLAGHDNKPIEKKLMLEYIDKTLFAFLRKFAPPNNVVVVVTANHSTPCKFKDHSAEPVPVLVYNGSLPREKKFNEVEAKKGTLGRIVGKDFFKKIGFNR